eukprot:5151391-Prymnesium_polylepis.3
MQDARIRVSILCSNYREYLRTNEKYKTVYEILSKDFSFYAVHKGYFGSYEEVKAKKDELTKVYQDKLVNYKPRTYSSIVSFD